MFTLFVSLGLIVGLTAVGILTLLTMSATGHLINEDQGIRADLSRMEYLQGGCTQAIVGRLDDAKSENDFQYNYLSQAVSDTAFVTTRLEKYRPLDSENELHDLSIGVANDSWLRARQEKQERQR